MFQPSRFVRPNSFDKACWFSRVWFGYLLALFYRGAKNGGLELSDIYECPQSERAETVLTPLQLNWTKELLKPEPSFAWTLFRTYHRSFILPTLIASFQEFVLKTSQPLLLSRVIRYFSDDPKIDYLDACLAAAGVCAASLAYLLLEHPNANYFERLGMRIRTATGALMYEKTLRLSRVATGETQVGQLINLMSNDMARFDEFAIYSARLLVAPAHALITLSIVYLYLGEAVFVGLAMIVLYVPLQIVVGYVFASIRTKVATLTDTRLRYMHELIAGIRVVKMYCWERPLGQRVEAIRKSEISKLCVACYIRAVQVAIYYSSSHLILFACLVAHLYLGNSLTAEKVFISLSLFYSIRLNVACYLPMAIYPLAELKVTCIRIQRFLLLEETFSKYQSDDQTHKHDQNSEAFLKVQNITIKWKSDDKLPTVQNISVDLKPGDLLVIIGPVGSGKSTFLTSLLHELRPVSGRISMKGKVSYSSEEAWLVNDSVRNNILFGEPYEAERYAKVVQVCALQPDLARMPAADRTLVGENGASLSGGQKTRIVLARAIYRAADIYLLDSPLSAVDPSVGKHIFHQCIMHYLKSKIRILVTHQLEFVKKANKILVLKEGKCLAYGSYEEVQKKKIDFVNLFERDQESGTLDRIHKRSSSTLNEPTWNETDFSKKETVNLDRAEEESTQRGSIACGVYWSYIRAGGGPFLLSLLMLFFALSQAVYNGSDIFVSYWVNKNPQINWDQLQDLIIYCSLIFSMFVCALIRSLVLSIICTRASTRLHSSIFSRLLGAQVAFYDGNPAGRILNRFARDLGCVDERFPILVNEFMGDLGEAVGVFVTVSIANYTLLIPSICLTLVILTCRQIYLKTARDIRRYDALTRSPIYAHIVSTINGLTSIRAFEAEQAFGKQFSTFQNDNTSTWFLYLSSYRAMGLVVDFCCFLFISIVSVVVMLSRDMTGGTAGLILSTAIMLSETLQFGIRQSAEFESQMTSVERILEYQNIDLEESNVLRSMQSPKGWPKSGEITIDRMSLSYRSKPVLSNIDAKIASGEKIGIVGRTGAGKSSMINALFRLVQPSGLIQIDGVNIKSINLTDLRKIISIIPQHPVIFSGSVRFNLDPNNEHPDTALWMALEKVQLKSHIQNFEAKLETVICESGAHLSVGQRQLMCLARAVLRHNPILILDEATANVDHQTDQLIQRTIRAEFLDCTVLTVAHRLNTVIDCDRVMVLDTGRLVEFDSPYNLIKKGGVFDQMCRQTGQFYPQLCLIAQNSESKLTYKKVI